MKNYKGPTCSEVYAICEWVWQHGKQMNELARFISPEEMVRTMAAGDCSIGAGFHTSANLSLVSSCLDNSRREPWHYGLRIPMISPILRLVARPELSRVKLTSRPTRLKKEVALAGKISPLG
jgi:hypothetical protein